MTAKKTMNDPYIPKSQKLAMMQKMLMKISAIEIEHEKFLQSLKFARLPDEEKEARKKKTANDENLQDEKTDTTVSDTSKEVAGQDEETENTDKIGGNIDLKLKILHIRFSFFICFIMGKESDKIMKRKQIFLKTAMADACLANAPCVVLDARQAAVDSGKKIHSFPILVKGVYPVFL